MIWASRAAARLAGTRPESAIFAGLQVAGVLDDSFPDFERQIQPGETGVPLFEMFDDAQGMEVVVESIAEALHLPIEFFFAGMREGRVADVVRQARKPPPNPR